MEKSYKEYLKHISTFVFDVDGVFTDGSILVQSDGQLVRTMNIKDGYALKIAVSKGYNVCIITGGKHHGVRTRFRELGITNIYLDAIPKIEPFKKYLEQQQIQSEHVLYMGDDIPDIPVMKYVGLPACPQDAVSEVKAVSKYISFQKGGKGCVRDIIEQVLKVQENWDIN